MKSKLLTLLLLFFALVSCKTILYFDEVYFESNIVKYNKEAKSEKIKIVYQNETSPYLNELKTKYPLSQIFDEQDTDMKKVLKVLNWTNSRWDHNGGNSPKNNDAISILKEAEEGGQFPVLHLPLCYETN